MTLLVDTGPLYAQADSRDPDHADVTRCLEEETGALIVPAFVAAEADYLILDRLGAQTEIEFLNDLAAGTYKVECLSVQEHAIVAGLAKSFNFGLADLSIVALAARFKTKKVLTLDERHFRTLKPLQGGHFTLLPADA